jgi:hypothetical protein
MGDKRAGSPLKSEEPEITRQERPSRPLAPVTAMTFNKGSAVLTRTTHGGGGRI